MTEGQWHSGSCEDTDGELWSGRTTHNSPGREGAPWRNRVWGQSGLWVGGAGDRVGIGRRVREESGALFWNVSLGGHSVLYRGVLGTGKGVKWFEAIHSSVFTSPQATRRGDFVV